MYRYAAFWGIYQIIFLEYPIVFQTKGNKSIRINGYQIKTQSVVDVV